MAFLHSFERLLPLLLAASCAASPAETKPTAAPTTTAAAAAPEPAGAPMVEAPTAARRHAEVAGPTPLVASGHPVDWWFAFKFNSAAFSGCGAAKSCPFGGFPQAYRSGEDEQFALASSDAPQLTMNTACIGEGDGDPVGATFGQIYNGNFSYVVWNDQFYQDPKITGCGNSCSAPWAHSKGMVAWGPDGDGFVMQVSTPSWPAAGSSAHPRASDGNTLGCVTDDNVLVSQHFFALKLTHSDLVKVLSALRNASVVTDTSNPQIVNSGGPSDVQGIVQTLGQKSNSTTFSKDTLAAGITLISKPSALHVPPWQMVSAVLGGVSLRAPTWWESHNPIPSTTPSTPIGCWDSSLGSAGAVDIATSGTWRGRTIGLKGGLGKDFNHAKIGIVTDPSSTTVIFGDMNQEGSLSGNCGVSQNGRGGLFFALDDATLHADLGSLLQGESDATPSPRRPRLR